MDSSNSKGVVKHIALAKFKEEIPADQVDQLIKGFANLVNLIPPLKAFHWGRDVSSENLHQGYTHVFECSFESMEGVAEYMAHPAHLDFAKVFVPALDNFIVIDYIPTLVQL
ncbi:stress-response A/B barrel domain-containing protein HS1-like [Euphorbia lathyris]|uniref:stress-response A/B barrel domain-containing protein HS1-like n=1 Tax=Euphorbia lathyris TaxID=212925 RepID=UPI0033134A9B